MKEALNEILMNIKNILCTYTPIVSSYGKKGSLYRGKDGSQMNEYNNKTASLKSFYTAQGKFYSVNGIGSVEEITKRLTGLIDGLL